MKHIFYVNTEFKGIFLYEHCDLNMHTFHPVNFSCKHSFWLRMISWIRLLHDVENHVGTEMYVFEILIRR